jgi:hypothetical protein
MDEHEYELQKSTQFNILLAHAKIDALTAMVEILFVKHGSTQKQFRAALKKATDAIVQKYLERLGDQFPREAAEIDLREKMPEIDQSFLDSLKFGDEAGEL